jgi:hypothetical protein
VGLQAGPRSVSNPDIPLIAIRHANEPSMDEPSWDMQNLPLHEHRSCNLQVNNFLLLPTTGRVALGIRALLPLLVWQVKVVRVILFFKVTLSNTLYNFLGSNLNRVPDIRFLKFHVCISCTPKSTSGHFASTSLLKCSRRFAVIGNLVYFL